jgi:hypothetical protein
MRKKMNFLGALELRGAQRVMLCAALSLAFVLLGYIMPLHVQAGSSLQQYRSVTSILAKVKQTDDLMNTVHSNPLVLEAIGRFLDIADTHHLPEADLETTLVRLFPLRQWKKRVPVFNIKTIRRGLHLVSLGCAASTQESSLYLFEGRTYHKIDDSLAGLITPEDVKTTGSLVTLKYERAHSEGREIVIATLTKQGATWRVTRVISEE